MFIIVIVFQTIKNPIAVSILGRNKQLGSHIKLTDYDTQVRERCQAVNDIDNKSLRQRTSRNANRRPARPLNYFSVQMLWSESYYSAVEGKTVNRSIQWC